MPLLTPSKLSAKWSNSRASDEQEIALLKVYEGEEPFENVSLSVGQPDEVSSSSVLQTSSGLNAPKLNKNCNTFQMRSRRRTDEPMEQPTSYQSSLNPAFVLVDIAIEAGDTLPSFAIKYHVTMSELKRLNSMFHEQDFHTRQRLKVPIHKYGILAERYLNLSDMQELNSSSHHVLLDLSSETNSPTLPSSPDGSQQDEVTQNNTFRTVVSSQSRAAKLFLQNMDRNLQRLAKEAMERRPRSPLANDDLLNSRHRIEALPPVGDGLGCHSADCGINVKALLCMILCLSIVLPAAFLIYKLYCLHHPEICQDSLDHSVNNGSAVTLPDHHLH